MNYLDNYEPPHPKEPKWKIILSVVAIIFLLFAFTWFKESAKKEIRRRNQEKASQEIMEYFRDNISQINEKESSR